MSAWRPIETAPKDGAPVLLCLKNPIPNDREDLRIWDGLRFIGRHPGVAADGFDMGWGFAAPVGMGGFPDDWIAGWQPSIHMPRWASRISLAVTAIKIERLHDISEEDAAAEGVEPHAMTARGAFFALWNVLHGAGAWFANPYVIAISFTRAKP